MWQITEKSPRETASIEKGQSSQLWCCNHGARSQGVLLAQPTERSLKCKEMNLIFEEPLNPHFRVTCHLHLCLVDQSKWKSD